jgi:hypothetical protein
MDEYRAAGDHLLHRWEKCVDSAGDFMLGSGHMCKHSGISVMLLSCILLLQ